MRTWSQHSTVSSPEQAEPGLFRKASRRVLRPLRSLNTSFSYKTLSEEQARAQEAPPPSGSLWQTPQPYALDHSPQGRPDSGLPPEDGTAVGVGGGGTLSKAMSLRPWKGWRGSVPQHPQGRPRDPVKVWVPLSCREGPVLLGRSWASPRGHCNL